MPKFLVHHVQGKITMVLMEYRDLYTQGSHLAAFWRPSLFSFPAGFFLRIISQMAACVYSMGFLGGNFEKGKKINIVAGHMGTICFMMPHVCCVWDIKEDMQK